MTRTSARAPRVLVVVNSLGFGGTERMIQRMTTYLNTGGRVLYTVCSLGEEGPIGAALRSEGIEVIALGERGGAVRQVLWGAARLRRLIKTGRFDLVHSFLYRSHCASRLARIGLASSVPLISSERCLGDNRGGAVRLANRLTSRMSDRILAVSQAVGDRAVRRDGVPRERVVVIPNGIEPRVPDPRDRERLRRILGLGDGHVLILYLGRLHREKGPDLLVEALARLRERTSDPWTAILIGDGEERDAVERQAAMLGLAGSVHLAGPRRRVAPWIDACDVLVLPSREEGMPVAALESMMLSRPVVATEVGGSREVVRNEETGLLVPPGDPQALAEALARLVRDEALRHRFGEAGRARALAEFTIDRMAEGTLALYAGLLETRGPARAPVAAAGAE